MTDARGQTRGTGAVSVASRFSRRLPRITSQVAPSQKNSGRAARTVCQSCISGDEALAFAADPLDAHAARPLGIGLEDSQPVIAGDHRLVTLGHMAEKPDGPRGHG